MASGGVLCEVPQLAKMGPKIEPIDFLESLGKHELFFRVVKSCLVIVLCLVTIFFSDCFLTDFSSNCKFWSAFNKRMEGIPICCPNSSLE